MSTDLNQTARMEAIRARTHCHCVVCSPDTQLGFNLQFHITDDGSIETVFDCARTYQGYENVLHGGVIATLLDSAMVHCLFAHGIEGLTAELNIRFKEPVRTDCPAQIRAWMSHRNRHLTRLEAEVVQETRQKVLATGKFMEEHTAQARR